MRRRIFAPLMFMGAVATALLSSPLPIAATDTTNLAGRPLDGSAATSCHGLVYARVDNKIALLSAGHCFGGNNVIVYGPNGSGIGYWGEDFGGWGGTKYDLAVIFLYNGNWPANLNRVYRGDPGNGTNHYWTILKDPPYELSCQSGLNGGTFFGWKAIYHNWQRDNTTAWSYRTGTLGGWVNNDPSQCRATSGLMFHGLAWKDSGSPFVMCCNAQGYVNTVFAITTSRNSSTGELWITPLYDGLKIMDIYYTNHSSFTGAHLCADPACT